MALKLRLSRGGRKARPFYKLVVADGRAPRDGRFIEKLGTYNPLLPNDNPNRFSYNEERVKYWLGQGAEASPRVSRFLGEAGLMEMPKITEKPKKSAPGKKAQERVKEREEKLKAKKEAEEAAKAEAEAAAAAASEEAEAAESAEEQAAAENTADNTAENTTEESAPAEAESSDEAVSAEAPAEESKADENKEEEKKDG